MLACWRTSRDYQDDNAVSFAERVRAAVVAFRDYNAEPIIDDASRYVLNHAFYSGEWRSDPRIIGQRRSDPRLYKNSLLLWNLARSVTRLYAQSVYQGDLSTDGKPLPDGTRGAIPIDPQTGNATTDEAILRACAELWSMWNWRQYLSLRPKMAAILGDCLTELVDDVDRGKVLPRTVWPGYVTDLELDLVGNIKRYAITYQVTIEQGERFGQMVKGETYTYRKEVDGEAFRYYKDGRPFDYYGPGSSVVRNPYGFVPAVWDRHEIVWGDRGMGAFAGGMQAMQHINSVFSHALDYQRKQFAAPIILKGGSTLGARRLGGLLAPRPLSTDPEADAARVSEQLDVLSMDEHGDFATVSFDVGKTVEMVRFLEEALVAEFPEARYGTQILEMTQLTAPGVERALGPIIGMVKQARANHDPQTIKLHQMAIAIIGQRLKEGEYPAEIVAARAVRYAAFRSFDLTSHGSGLLDFGIPDRPVISESEDERLDRLIKIQVLESPALMRKAGVDEATIAEMIAEREQSRREQEAMFGMAGGERDTNEPGRDTEEVAAR